jgi:hypothetical protein
MDEQSRLEKTAGNFFENHAARYRRREKDAFLDACRGEFTRLGYADEEIVVQKSFLSKNLVVGPADAEYLVTAHYDTPGRNGFLLCFSPLVGQTLANVAFSVILIAAMFFSGFNFTVKSEGLIMQIFDIAMLVFFAAFILGFLLKNKQNRNDNTSGVIGVIGVAAHIAENEELRKKCAFVLFDNEEWGLLGASAFASWRKKTFPKIEDCVMINLDCIGNGDTLLVAATKRHEEWKGISEFLKGEGYNVAAKRSGMIFLSDHAHFPKGLQLAFVRKSALGPLYIPKIHTSRDTVCDVPNIGKLCGSVYRYVCKKAQE